MKRSLFGTGHIALLKSRKLPKKYEQFVTKEAHTTQTEMIHKRKITLIWKLGLVLNSAYVLDT